MKQRKVLNLIIRANQEDKEALNDLGHLYFTGLHVKKDYQKALEYYQRAAKQNYPNAQFNLGLMYANGFGVPQNMTLSIKWYTKAALQNYAPAQFNLACIYQNASPTLPQAIYWYQQAAHHFASAQHNLGWCYLHGVGVEKNLELAIHWITQAAEQHVPQAERQLGECYFTGLGVRENKAYAAEWFKKAARCSAL